MTVTILTLKPCPLCGIEDQGATHNYSCPNCKSEFCASCKKTDSTGLRNCIGCPTCGTMLYDILPDELLNHIRPRFKAGDHCLLTYAGTTRTASVHIVRLLEAREWLYRGMPEYEVACHTKLLQATEADLDLVHDFIAHN